MSIRDEVIPHVANIEDLGQIWCTLKLLYENSGNAQKLYLKSKLHSFRMEEGGKVADFLKEIREVTNQLSAIGDSIKEHEIVEHILNSMPENYDNIINTIGCKSIYPPLTKLTRILMHEEVRRERRLTKRAIAKALMIKVKGQAKGARSTFRGGCCTKRSTAEVKRDDSGQKNGTTASPNNCCGWCGKSTHFLKDCEEFTSELKHRAKLCQTKVVIPQANILAQSDTFKDFEDPVDTDLEQISDLKSSMINLVVNSPSESPQAN